VTARVARAVALGLVALAGPAACWQSGGDAADPRSRFGREPASSDGIGPPSGVPTITRVEPPFDVVSTSGAIEQWPRLVPGIATRSISSFDRAGGNDDGFAGTWSQLYEDPDTKEAVIFDAAGPGVLRTMWFTSGGAPFDPLRLGTMRFRFDGEDKPRIVVDADALFRGETAPFTKPLVQDEKTSTGGRVSWVPLPFRGRLVVTAQQRPAFYAMHYETFPSDWDVASYRVGDRDAKLEKTFGETALSALPLEDVASDVTREGAGTIDVLRFEPAGTPKDDDAVAARIRVWFDGASEPQIDAPLSTFFGSGLGSARVSSVPWTMKDGAWESRLPMPYWQRFRVLVEGLPGKLRLHVGPSRFARGEAGWLHAKRSRAQPVAPGKDFVYVDEHESHGKIVATVLTVLPNTPSDKRWWEGDMRTRVDGARGRTIHGTGHEDDHLGGWSNEFFTLPFTLPMQGCPRSDVVDPNPKIQINANATMYRVWPGIPFLSGVRHSTEHGYTDAVTYDAVTFFYGAPRSRLVSTDAFDVADPDAAAAHGLASELRAASTSTEAVTGGFEGEPGPQLSSTAVRFREPFDFALEIRPENAGVVLRRLFDASQRETARVIVEGVEVGAILHAEPDAVMRWAERDFFLPPSVTRGKSRVAIRIAPMRTAFSAARFEALVVEP
jgi:hypothetical protein